MSFDFFFHLIDVMAGAIWNQALLYVVLAAGLIFIILTRAIQFRDFAKALRALFRRSEKTIEGDVSPVAALMTAVGGIVGNGNIAGVATAIVSGGPGALFWMWISGIVGMGTMFAESVLGVRYRRRGKDSLFVGGPMYYMRDGLGWKYVGGFFAVGLAIKSLLATTSVQSNSIALALKAEFGLQPIISCTIVAILTGIVILGGVKSVGRVSEIVAPFMGVLYLVASAIVLIIFARQIPDALALIFKHAFTPMAGVGGAAGITVQQAFRFGIARGVYSNEAGTGSVPIAHASAKTDDPIQQGRIAMLGVFLDTLVVATATGLVLVATGVWNSGKDSTAAVSEAFGVALGDFGGPIVLISSFLFGLTTLISWSFYGEQCAAYILGPKARLPYRIAYCIAILGGAAAGSKVIWSLGDLLNGIMTFPNLIAIVLLSGQVLAAMRQSSNAKSPKLGPK